MSKELKKYVELVNHYVQNKVSKLLSIYPWALDETYVIQHKVDGSNFQISWWTDNDLRFASRNNWLNIEESFQKINLAAFKKDNQLLIDKLKAIVNDINYHKISYLEYLENIEKISLYGELFGPGINGRVNYGPERRFQCFDLMVNDKILPILEMNRLMLDYDFMDYAVETFAVVDGLQKALDFDIKITSSDIVDGGIIEGVVIKPFRKVFIIDHDIFYIKKKNDEFSEKSKVGKKTASTEKNEESVRLKNIFLSYLNTNRILSCFSKYEPIKSDSEIGKYLKIILDDMKKDFIQENDISGVPGEDLKWLFNVGANIAQELKKHLG